MDNAQKKVACFRCLRRKERLDAIERHYLMLQASVEHHVKHKTEMKELCDKLDSMITELKDDFEKEYKSL